MNDIQESLRVDLHSRNPRITKLIHLIHCLEEFVKEDENLQDGGLTEASYTGATISLLKKRLGALMMEIY